MPSAALSPCSTCKEVGCTVHAKVRALEQEQRRGTAHARGYTYRDWQPFRRRFFDLLVDACLTPVCGAVLPTGPRTEDSRCQAQGLLTFTSADGSSLHLDHEPPLSPNERTDTAAVCDPHRIQLLCLSCHNAKTAREQEGRLR